MPSLASLRTTVPQVGRLERILLRPARREHPLEVTEAEAVAGRGLAGDRRAERIPSGGASPRQVTLVQAEHLAVVAALLDRDDPVDPALLRRNLVVAGLPLLAARELRLRVGGVELAATGRCHPCSRMEEALGTGGYQAMRGHGGITATIVVGGVMRVGDEVTAFA